MLTRRVPVVWHPDYEVDIGTHVFPTQKYRLIRQALLAEQVIDPDGIWEPEPATDEDVLLAVDRDYFEKMRDDRLSIFERQVLEVPFSPELREAMWLCAGGTTLTGRLALEHGIAVHLGGGFHHAFPDHGEGFCLINDTAIAVRRLRHEGVIERVAIVDLDVHHGNGTAATFAEEPEVFTFSMHQQNNYPAWKPSSDRDLGLRDGTTDDEYLSMLREHLPQILEQHRPELLFYLAGADPYREDQLGGLGLTLSGLRERDRTVLRLCQDHEVPAAVLLAGGYALNQADTVSIHAGTVKVAQEVLSGGEPVTT